MMAITATHQSITWFFVKKKKTDHNSFFYTTTKTYSSNIKKKQVMKLVKTLNHTKNKRLVQNKSKNSGTQIIIMIIILIWQQHRQKLQHSCVNIHYMSSTTMSILWSATVPQ